MKYIKNSISTRSTNEQQQILNVYTKISIIHVHMIYHHQILQTTTKKTWSKGSYHHHYINEESQEETTNNKLPPDSHQRPTKINNPQQLQPKPNENKTSKNEWMQTKASLTANDIKTSTTPQQTSLSDQFFIKLQTCSEKTTTTRNNNEECKCGKENCIIFGTKTKKQMKKIARKGSILATTTETLQQIKRKRK